MPFRTVRDDIAASRNLAPRNLQVPVEEGNYGTLLIFRDYSFTAPGTSGFASTAGSNGGDSIFLPLPENIQDSFTIRVQRADLGAAALLSEVLSETSAASGGDLNISQVQEGTIKAIKGMLPSAATDGAAAYDAISNFANELAGGSTDASQIDKFSKDAAFLLRKTVGSSTIGRGIDTGTGTFVNPKAALSFEGVEMKNHSFSWTIAPKDSGESENLREVIRTINRNILPEYAETQILQRALLRYPSMVDVFFVGIDDNFYYKFKTAMVQTFNVNYTPNGVSVLRGGRPAAVTMTMNIIESDIHTREDYQ